MNTPASVEHISQRATLWIIAAIAGFAVGLSPIVGPIAWWKTRKLRDELRSMGVTVRTNADAAVVVSAVTTALTYAGFALILLVLIGIRFSPTY